MSEYPGKFTVTLVGQDVRSAPTFTARTVRGAKSIGTKQFGEGYLHHKIVVSDWENFTVAVRRVGDAKWTDYGL